MDAARRGSVSDAPLPQVDEQPRLVTRFTTRSIDIVVGALALLVSIPVIVVAVLGASVTLRANPIFVQYRIGHRGERFRLLKIRTLPVDVPTDVDKYALASYEIPAFTEVLRRHHIDELLQLLLVIRGTMALVGPRPELPVLQERIRSDAAAVRAQVRPGCTGLWQVSADAPGLIHEATQHDRFYVEHRTARLDLWILYRTVVLLVRPGHYVGLDTVPGWTTRPMLQPLRRGTAPIGPTTDR